MLGDIGERESRESGDIKQRSPHLPIKTVCLHFKNQNISVYLFYLCICVGLPNCLMYFDWSISSFPFAGVYDSCVWCFSCWFLKLRNRFCCVGLLGLGLAGGRDLGFGFPWNGGIPRPHRVTWSQPINMHPVKSPRESWKAHGCLSEQKPAPFVPIELL